MQRLRHLGFYPWCISKWKSVCTSNRELFTKILVFVILCLKLDKNVNRLDKRPKTIQPCFHVGSFSKNLDLQLLFCDFYQTNLLTSLDNLSYDINENLSPWVIPWTHSGLWTIRWLGCYPNTTPSFFEGCNEGACFVIIHVNHRTDVQLTKKKLPLVKSK